MEVEVLKPAHKKVLSFGMKRLPRKFLRLEE